MQPILSGVENFSLVLFFQLPQFPQLSFSPHPLSNSALRHLALARDIVRQLATVQQVVPDWLSTIADGYTGGGGGRGGQRDLRGRKGVVKDDAADDDWGDSKAKDAAAKGANFGGTGFGASNAAEEEEWD